MLEENNLLCTNYFYIKHKACLISPKRKGYISGLVYRLVAQMRKVERGGVDFCWNSLFQTEMECPLSLGAD